MLMVDTSRASVERRANERFRHIRDSIGQSYLEAVKHSASVPGGLCISAVARIRRQGSNTVASLAAVQHEISRAVERFEPYPEESLHISLLGCTERQEELDTSQSRITDIVSIVRNVLDETSPCVVNLGSVNATGVQVFVEVVPHSATWAQARSALGTALTAYGEKPIVYRDPEPMHLNVGRLGSGIPVPTLLETVGRKDFALDRPLELSVVELVVTDFTLSPDVLVVLDEFLLSASG